MNMTDKLFRNKDLLKQVFAECASNIIEATEQVPQTMKDANEHFMLLREQQSVPRGTRSSAEIILVDFGRVEAVLPLKPLTDKELHVVTCDQYATFAEVADQLAANLGWKPFASAPKDGTRCEFLNIETFVLNKGYWNTKRQRWIFEKYGVRTTHWRKCK